MATSMVHFDTESVICAEMHACAFREQPLPLWCLWLRNLFDDDAVFRVGLLRQISLSLSAVSHSLGSVITRMSIESHHTLLITKLILKCERIDAHPSGLTPDHTAAATT